MDIRPLSTPRRARLMARYPVASFIVLAFVLSYLVGLPFNMLVSGFLKKGLFTNLLVRVFTVYGPGISAIIVTQAVSGSAGVALLLKKLQPARQHVGWYIAIPIICLLITSLGFSLAGIPIAHIGNYVADHWLLFIGYLFLQILIVGIGEELGWRGFLLPNFSARRLLIVATLMNFAVWAVWHFPVFLAGIHVVFPWLIILLSLSFIFSWLWYKARGNVFIIALTHAAVNTPVVLLEHGFENSFQTLIFRAWEMTGYAYLVVAVFVVVGSWKIWNHQQSGFNSSAYNP